MILPLRVQVITRTLYLRHPALSTGTEDQRRSLARMICEQTRLELGATWGWKKAGPTNPPSKDAIAQLQPDARLFAWDLFNGSTGLPNPNPESHDITGQVFIDVSPGYDYIGHPETPVPPPVPPGQVPTPPPPSGLLPYDESKAVEFGLATNDIYTESGATVDPGMIAVFATRAAYDYYSGRLTWPDAKRGHLNGMRAVYGLPPI